MSNKALAAYANLLNISGNKLIIPYPELEIIYTHYYNTWNGRPNDPSATYTTTEDCMLFCVYIPTSFSSTYEVNYVKIVLPNGTILQNDELSQVSWPCSYSNKYSSIQKNYYWILPKGTIVSLQGDVHYDPHGYYNGQAYIVFAKPKFYCIDRSLIEDNIVDIY